MNAPAPLNPQLSRLHYKRLRSYFRSPEGASSLADNIDLDLAAQGLIERATNRFPGGAVVSFKITPAGTVELSAENQREKERRQPHHSLAERVAVWQRDQGRATWENIEFLVDLPAGAERTRQAVRPDVFSLATTRNPANICPHVYEVKVSRSDFLADVARPEKRGAYSAIAEKVFYVAPAGIVAVEDCPAECGLIVEDNGTFTVLKKAKKRRVELSPSHFMNLILKPGNVPALF